MDGISIPEKRCVIFHGTNAENIESIRKNGLLPWNTTRSRSNWATVPTRLDTVYLSDVYGLYYAEASCGETSDLALVEIDDAQLDQAGIYPDEDFIAQIFQDAKAIGEKIPTALDACADIEELTNRIDPASFKTMSTASRLESGNIGYRGAIPPTAIRRATIVPFEQNEMLYHLIRDPALSIINKTLVGERYASLCRFAIDGIAHPLALQSVEEYLAMPSLAIKTTSTLFERVDGLNRDRLRTQRGMPANDVFAADSAVREYHARIRKRNARATALFCAAT